MAEAGGGLGRVGPGVTGVTAVLRTKRAAAPGEPPVAPVARLPRDLRTASMRRASPRFNVPRGRRAEAGGQEKRRALPGIPHFAGFVYGFTVTVLPGLSISYTRSTSSFLNRMQPMLDCLPIESGSMVPWMP